MGVLPIILQKKKLLGSKLNYFANYTAKVDYYFKNTNYFHWPLNETTGNLAICRGSNPVNNNFVSNPGFEAGVVGWVNGVKTTTEGEYRSGTSAIKVTSSGTTLVASRNFFVRPGRVYNLKFWIRGDGTNAPLYSIVREDYGAWISAPASTGITGVDFAQITKQFTAPAGFNTVKIEFRTAAVNGAYFCLDDIVLEDISGIESADVSGILVSGYTLNQDGFNTNEKSIYLDGTKAIILSKLIANNFLPESSGEGTLLIWGKPDLDALAEGASRWCVKFKTVLTSSEANYIDMFVASTVNRIGMQFKDDVMTEVYISKSQAVSEWICFAAKWDASGIKWFVDGVQVGETSSIGGVWSKPFDGSIMFIGGGLESEGVWKGYLAHCVLSGTALSDTAIQKLSAV